MGGYILAFEREKATRRRFSQVLTTFHQFQKLRNFHPFANFQEHDFENALGKINSAKNISLIRIFTFRLRSSHKILISKVHGFGNFYELIVRKRRPG